MDTERAELNGDATTADAALHLDQMQVGQSLLFL
jgi:hypothetical protein